MRDDIVDTIDEARGAKIARYVTARSSQSEEAEVREWCAAAPGREEYVESLRRTWEQAGVARAPDLEDDVDTAWAEVQRRRDARRTRFAAPESANPAIRPTPGRARLLRVAAVLIIVLGLGVMWRTMSPEPTDRPRAVDMREYATDRAQRGEVRLPDGSTVVLNVDTRLRIPRDYGNRARTVYLEGEARFAVEHDERRPFVVHTSSLVAEDLGTVFGVRAYPNASSATVVVAEGLVDFRTASSPGPAGAERLEPGHLARVDANGRVEVDRNADPTEYLAFADGRLVFRGTPLRDVVAQIGRWYDLDVRLVDPELASIPLTASFQHEPVPHVLDLIALTLDLRYEREGRVVTFQR